MSFKRLSHGCHQIRSTKGVRSLVFISGHFSAALATFCCLQASPRSRNGFWFVCRHSWEQQQGAPLVTFWKLAVGLCRYWLGDLLANLVRVLVRTFWRGFWCGFWRGFFQLGVRTSVRNFALILCRRRQTAESRIFIKIRTEIQTQNPHTFPSLKVGIWKEVEQWWAHQAICGRLMVGSIKKTVQDQIPLREIFRPTFGYAWVTFFAELLLLDSFHGKATASRLKAMRQPGRYSMKHILNRMEDFRFCEFIFPWG